MKKRLLALLFIGILALTGCQNKEDAKLSIYDYFPKGLDISSITYISNNGNKTNITDKYKVSFLGNKKE